MSATQPQGGSRGKSTAVFGCDVAAAEGREKAAVVGEDGVAGLGREGELARGRLRHYALGPAPEQASQSVLATHASGKSQAVPQPLTRAWVLAAADAAAALAAVGAPDEGAHERAAHTAHLKKHALVLHAKACDV